MDAKLIRTTCGVCTCLCDDHDQLFDGGIRILRKAVRSLNDRVYVTDNRLTAVNQLYDAALADISRLNARLDDIPEPVEATLEVAADPTLDNRMSAMQSNERIVRLLSQRLDRHESRLDNLTRGLKAQDRMRREDRERMEAIKERLSPFEKVRADLEGYEPVEPVEATLEVAEGTDVSQIMDILRRHEERLAKVEDRLSPPEKEGMRDLPPDCWDRDGVQWTAKRYQRVPGRTTDDILWEALFPDSRRPGYERIAQMLGENLEALRGPITWAQRSNDEIALLLTSGTASASGGSPREQSGTTGVATSSGCRPSPSAVEPRVLRS